MNEDPQTRELRLYVSGDSALTPAAIGNLERLQGKLRDAVQVEVIDVFSEPERAATDGILATPTLIANGPGRARRVVGDLSDLSATMIGLGLAGKEPA